MRSAPALVLLPVLALLGACPPDPEQPTRPDDAKPCEVDADCAPDGGAGQCGEVFACIDQRCEVDPSRYLPCR